MRLAAVSGGLVTIREAAANGRDYLVELRVNAPVGTDEHYEVQGLHRLRIVLPDRFPADKPIASLDHPILAPNVWPNGAPCILDQWVPSWHLDKVVCGVIEEIQGLAPNFDSVANREAGRLYARSTFVAELRRRLGPPVRLAASERPVRSGVRTVPSSEAARGRATVRSVRPTGTAGNHLV